MRTVLAERLGELRVERDLSQAKLAEFAGVDRKTINRIENGHFSPALDTIVRLSVALDISPSELLIHQGLAALAGRPCRPAQSVDCVLPPASENSLTRAVRL